MGAFSEESFQKKADAKEEKKNAAAMEEKLSAAKDCLEKMPHCITELKKALNIALCSVS